MKVCVLWLTRTKEQNRSRHKGLASKFQNMPPSDTLLPAKPHLVKLTNILQIPANERDQHSPPSQRLLEIYVLTAIETLKMQTPKVSVSYAKKRLLSIPTNCLTSYSIHQHFLPDEAQSCGTTSVISVIQAQFLVKLSHWRWPSKRLKCATKFRPSS